MGRQSVLCMGALLGCWAPQGPRSPSRPWAAAGAGAGAPSREEAKALARPAGAAEDTGAAAALDGGSARRGQASRRSRRAGGAKPAQHRRREHVRPIRPRVHPNSPVQQNKAPLPRSTGRRIEASARRQSVAGTIACSCSITPGSTKTQGCSAATGTLNTRAKASRLRCASPPVRYA